MDYDDFLEKKYNTQIKLREKLFSLRDDNYKEFSSKLLPGVYNILGVRIPKLRKIAKDIAKNDWRFYLEIAQDEYFEEVMLEGLVIGYIKEDFQVVKNAIENFIPKIYNWSICDSFCNTIKITELYQEDMWKLIEPYFSSDKTYQIRFAVVMSLNYYVEEEYMDRLFSLYKNTNREDHYVKMAIGWAISYFFIKFPGQTYDYLKKNSLDKETHNMAIQKIIDSKQVSDENKNLIREIRR